jgi:hypothetical protein
MAFGLAAAPSSIPGASTEWCLFLARSAMGTEPKAETDAETRRRFFGFVLTSRDAFPDSALPVSPRVW